MHACMHACIIERIIIEKYVCIILYNMCNIMYNIIQYVCIIERARVRCRLCPAGPGGRYAFCTDIASIHIASLHIASLHIASVATRERL